jgi:hypothetical protein
MKHIRTALFLMAAAAASSCATPEPPGNVENACAILKDRPQWGRALDRAAVRWGAPQHVAMAIIWKESSFEAKAQTSRKYVLGFIPNGRRSSAYGYAQAIDGTWDWYRDSTGNSGADRDDFDDASDFVGWYMARSQASAGIAMDDAFNQYLAYHEGHAGFRKQSWRDKPWLMRVAAEVKRKAETYERQIAACRV